MIPSTVPLFVVAEHHHADEPRISILWTLYIPRKRQPLGQDNLAIKGNAHKKQ